MDRGVCGLQSMGSKQSDRIQQQQQHGPGFALVIVPEWSRFNSVHTQSRFPPPGNLPNPGTKGLGRSPGEGKGYPLQYSGLENSMDCIVHGSKRVRHDWLTFTFIYMYRILSLLSNSLEAYAEKIDKSTNHSYYTHYIPSKLGGWGCKENACWPRLGWGKGKGIKFWWNSGSLEE